ncbi:hypothetical protein C8F04DRAFT_1067826 [Mycena alexandri]|uniref:Uncharacterized protein n=1 Tax=Mycena alexandri TaxID=1745969 RepID=A0AAD6TJR8_9AGAR|nr:hypothetical protein C8F04DRAFT_1067826 [Mycena alexandri]
MATPATSVSTALPSPISSAVSRGSNTAPTPSGQTPSSPRVLDANQVGKFYVTMICWRLLNTMVMLGLGIFKAVVTYRGQPTAPKTLDWVTGVVWALISYWMALFEADSTQGLAAGYYNLHVRITPCRCVNTVVVLSLGVYKAVTTYLGQTSTSTILDWVVGVGWVLISYWTDILEADNPSLAIPDFGPWFFSCDFGGRKRVHFNRPLLWYKPHVDITPWRSLNTIVVLGLGTCKISAAFRGQTTVPTTLEWITGVVWLLIAYWLGFSEKGDPSWFLSRDISGALSFAMLAILGVVGVLYVLFVMYLVLSSIPMMWQEYSLCLSSPKVLCIRRSSICDIIAARRGLWDTFSLYFVFQ